jgi:polyisoprenoid-binding protein YceI
MFITLSASLKGWFYMIKRLILLLFFPIATSLTPASARSTLRLSPSTVRFVFVVDATGWPQTKGTFTSFDGQLLVDFDKPATSSVTFKVATRSINVGSTSFSNYLRSDAFFNVEKYPSMTFVSTKVEKINETLARVTGDLTLLDTTLPVTIDVEVDQTSAKRKISFVAKGHLNRLAFGMNTGFPVISNRVDFSLSTNLQSE